MKSAKIFIFFALLLVFALQVSAQSVQSPNELNGYEFFAKGKLKNLQFAVSSKDDVKEIFGANCEKKCDYDANWSISFEYFDDIWMKESRNEKDEKIVYKLDSKYLRKLRSIEIRPKKPISFANVAFPRVFQKFLVASSGFNSDKSRVSGDEAFQDSSGLTYEICQINCDSGDKELVLIRYDIPKELKDTLFILQK